MSKHSLIDRLKAIEVRSIRGCYEVLGSRPIDAAHRAIKEAIHELKWQANVICVQSRREVGYRSALTDIMEGRGMFGVDAKADLAWAMERAGEGLGAPEPADQPPTDAQPDELWKQFAGDFNSCTDEEIEQECKDEAERLEKAEAWLEAVESWKRAGKPRA